VALNYIWSGFFIVAFVVACLKFLVTGDTQVFSDIVKATFSMSEIAIMSLALPLAGAMTLWLGLLNIGEKAGAIRFLAKIVGPFFSRLFPEIPREHPANGQIILNFSANMLGLDNAATPIGLKAMDSMQELNPKKDTASNAQIMFLVLNTSGLTIIPVTIMAQRSVLGAANPADIFIPILLATYFSSLIGLIVVAIKQKINLFDQVILGWLGSITAIIAGILWYFSSLEPEALKTQSSFFASFIILTIIVSFIAGALRKKVDVFGVFIEGAKEGFTTSIKVMPYLVGILVGIAVFRASGAMGYVEDALAFIIGSIGMNTDFSPAIPTALMKPLSGSGAKGLAVELMNTLGVDHFASKVACVMQGAADTTFYIIALYFGSVGIKKTRYAITAGLLADLAGITAAIFISYIFFH
jgi:spore maturation protein SpmA